MHQVQLYWQFHLSGPGKPTISQNPLASTSSTATVTWTCTKGTGDSAQYRFFKDDAVVQDWGDSTTYEITSPSYADYLNADQVHLTLISSIMSWDSDNTLNIWLYLISFVYYFSHTFPHSYSPFVVDFKLGPLFSNSRIGDVKGAGGSSSDTQLDVWQLDLSPLIAPVHQLTLRCLLDNYRFLTGIPNKYSSHFHTEPGCTPIVLLDVVKVQWALLLFLLYISPAPMWCLTYVLDFTSFFVPHLVGYLLTPQNILYTFLHLCASSSSEPVSLLCTLCISLSLKLSTFWVCTLGWAASGILKSTHPKKLPIYLKLY